MLINTKWLLDYLEPACTTQQLLEALPQVGLEIEELQDLSAELQAVRVGFVREKAAVPGVDNLYACKIEIARGQLIPVVCAAEHEVQVGWGVPVAPAGTRLPTGKHIAAGQVHGHRSEGMICLDGEMGLVATGSGMQVFRDEATLGQPLPSVMPIDEYLVELNVLPNRPDCLGMIGIAREVAALLKLKLKYPDAAKGASPGKSGSGPVPVEVREADLCPRYMCQLIRGVKVGPSPQWLKSRLLAIGSRPINNVVDITNFVLYEYGQPLHAFDFNRLKGGKIVVRRMAAAEKMQLLSDKVIDGAETPLVIADGERPVALAGIMGGRDTETNDGTTDVLLEAAYFDPVNIRKTVKKIDIGLESRGTASSYRFERGTDPNVMLPSALQRASALIAELAGGRLEGFASDVYAKRQEPRTIALTAAGVSACLGMPVQAPTIRDALRRLEMQCGDDLKVTVPTWRVDVNDKVVLIEDVARQLGYDTIPTRPSATTPTIGTRGVLDRLRHVVAEHLVAAGYLESRNPPLESPDATTPFGDAAIREQIRLSNPANRDMSVVRRSLLPGLLASAERNLRRGTTSIRLFEIDRTFRLEGDKPAPHDRWMLTAIAGGPVREYDWRGGGTKVDFYDLKGEVENLLDAVGARARTFGPLTLAPYVAGAAAEIIVGGTVVGRLGELAQGLIDTGKMQVKLFAIELDLEALEPAFLAVPKQSPLPKTPAVTRDLAIVVGGDESFAPIEKVIRTTAGPALESLQLVDVYRGQQVAAGKKSLALHLVLRDPARTLTADDASTIMTRVLDALQQQFKAELRA